MGVSHGVDLIRGHVLGVLAFVAPSFALLDVAFHISYGVFYKNDYMGMKISTG